jgi:hypothetical protein
MTIAPEEYSRPCRITRRATELTFDRLQTRTRFQLETGVHETST